MNTPPGEGRPDQRQQRLGLRERKKQEYVEHMYRTALRLFRERSYDATGGRLPC